MNTYDLKGKVAVVTGAMRGIGKGIALLLARNGARVVVTDIDKASCEQVVKEIEKAGGTGVAFKLDVTNEQEIQDVVKSVHAQFGRIDILVNNAGIFIQEELDGSIAGFVGFEVASVYSATKGAIVNLTRELALELGKYGINVNAVAPGVIETPMTDGLLEDKNVAAALLSKIPYGRTGKPEDIANGVGFLVSDDSSYIY